MNKSLLFGLLLLAAATSAADIPFTDVGHESGVAVVTDVTDPAHPFEVGRSENVVNECGVTVLMQYLMGLPNMPAPSGGTETLGNYCSNRSNGEGAAQLPCLFDGTAAIVIGGGSAAGCTSGGATPGTTGSPWKCCTGSGTGCTPSGNDLVTFAEYQPNQTVVGTTANYAAWVAASKPNAPFVLTSANAGLTAALYWDGANHEGLQYVATAAAGTATGQWCEFAVRSAPGALACGLSTSSTSRAGWQLDHGVFGSCLTKPAGAVYQITITVNLS